MKKRSVAIRMLLCLGLMGVALASGASSSPGEVVPSQQLQSVGGQVEDLSTFIRTQMQEAKVPGLSIALIQDGEITLVAIGPLTNVALAIRQEPRLVQTVKEVIVMGGALRYEGNTTALAEFNTYVDPHAAHIVYHSGMPITLVPLDVTYQCVLTKEDVQRMPRGSSSP